MTLSGAQDNVPVLCHLYRGTQCILTVVKEQIRLCAVVIGENFAVDCRGILGVRVVRGNDGVIGIFSGGFSQFSAAIFCPTANGAEETDQPVRMVFPQYPKRACETESIVRIID